MTGAQPDDARRPDDARLDQDTGGELEVVTDHIADGAVVIARVRGEMDMATVRGMHAALSRAVVDHPQHLVVDLGGVTFLSSRCLGVLVDLIADETVTGVVHVTGVVGNHPVERAITAVELTEHLRVRRESADELARLLTAEASD